ncbi:hypothetical protein FHU13_003754 [Methylobacterium sp. R2-1]|nr:hypothetical protein [Methylobacterium sp. R2-1]
MVGRIARNSAADGEETHLKCAGQVRWIKDAGNGHIHARCVT